MPGGDDAFQWDSLVPHLLHPLKVSIVEAMSWVGEPISPRDLDRMFDDMYGVSLVAYHVRGLAEMEAIEKVGERAVRGALQSFYVLTAKEPADSPLACE